MTRKNNKFDFEQALATLEALVEKMEQGELSLEQSLTAFEQGIKLTRECQAALDKAEQKVQILMSNTGIPEAEPYAGIDEIDPTGRSDA
jgi:exodeoxyribonuclease VII small subunit